MRKIPVISVLLFIACTAVSYVSPEPDGIWDGIINTPGTELEIAVTFTTGPDGKLTATLDVPEQGHKDVPLSTVDSFLLMISSAVVRRWTSGLAGFWN